MSSRYLQANTWLHPWHFGGATYHSEGVPSTLGYVTSLTELPCPFSVAPQNGRATSDTEPWEPAAQRGPKTHLLLCYRSVFTVCLPARPRAPPGMAPSPAPSSSAQRMSATRMSFEHVLSSSRDLLQGLHPDPHLTPNPTDHPKPFHRPRDFSPRSD